VFRRFYPGDSVICVKAGHTGLTRLGVYTIAESDSALVALQGFPELLFHPDRFEAADPSGVRPTVRPASRFTPRPRDDEWEAQHARCG
jgi:hypothetical protein